MEVTLQKMKWDPDTDENDPDEDDKAAFDGMRKVGYVSSPPSVGALNSS